MKRLACTIVMLTAAHAAPALAQAPTGVTTAGSPRALPTTARGAAAGSPDVPGPEDSRIVALIARFAEPTPASSMMDARKAILQLGLPAAPELEKALASPDWRQRQVAANCLCELHVAPSRKLWEVCIEGLKDDRLPFNGQRYTDICNARSSTVMLIANAEQAEDLLVAAMNSTDGQQRFLAAFALGYAGRGLSAARVVEVLAPHLRDNTIPCDALLAGMALYRMGPAALKPLAAQLPGADTQAHRLIEAIMRDITAPPKDDAECRRRAELFDVRKDYGDDPWFIPHVQHTLDDVFIGLNKPTSPS